MSEAFDIGVVGAGAWGCALATLWAQKGRQIGLWARDPAKAAAMQASRRTARLPGVILDENITVVDAFPSADMLVVCVPMQQLRRVLQALPTSDAPVVLCCKGLEADTFLLPPEVAAQALPGRNIAVLTGPNFAHEIAHGLPAAAVLADASPAMRASLTHRLSTRRLRLYGSADVTGAALGGAAKNVIAIAAGVVIGAGLGENARAALITRGLAEIGRMAAALGGRVETVSGLSGLGDLLLTCTGETSRNFSLGAALGRGEILAAILAARDGVTEGVATAPALLARAASVGVELPVTAAVVGLLAGEVGVAETVAGLMGRALREE